MEHRVFAGYDHALVLSERGALFGFGKNDCHQLSDKLADRNVMMPVMLAENVKMAAAGFEGSIYLGCDGNICILGNGKVQDCFSSPEGVAAVYADCSERRYWIQDEDSVLYRFGKDGIRNEEREHYIIGSYWRGSGLLQSTEHVPELDGYKKICIFMFSRIRKPRKDTWVVLYQDGTLSFLVAGWNYLERKIMDEVLDVSVGMNIAVILRKNGDVLFMHPLELECAAMEGKRESSFRRLQWKL